MKFFHFVVRVLHVLVRFLTLSSIGLGGLVLAFVIFPVLKLCVHPDKLFRRAMRASVSFAFRMVLRGLRMTTLIRIKFEHRERLRDSRGAIIMANHPSILDVVMLIAYTPQADCIVTARMWVNPFLRGVVSSIYIPNSLGIEEIAKLAKKSLAEGNNLIVFPEGTRTVRGKVMRLHRGGAHIALRTGADFLPIHIEATDPVGLRKGDGIFAAPPDGIIRYLLQVQEPIPTASFISDDLGLAARILTREVGSRIVSYQ